MKGGTADCLEITFISGGKNVLLKQFDKNLAVNLIESEYLTYFGSFPPVLERVLDTAKESGSGLESLKLVYGLEGPENINRLQEETGAVFWTGFGQAETTAFVTASPASECPGASGRPTLINSVSVVNEVDPMDKRRCDMQRRKGFAFLPVIGKVMIQSILSVWWLSGGHFVVPVR